MTKRDRIEKQVTLRASRARVWRAITDSQEFGAWFKAVIEGPFAAGQTARGRITYPGYEHLKLEMRIEKIEPEHTFSFRWHPGPEESGPDDPLVLVEIHLEEVEGGTRLTLTESGYEALSPERREAAFRSNEGGWEEQLETNLRGHVESRRA
jgi:uncharacterized protein YndB with AHSA1/START domain